MEWKNLLSEEKLRKEPLYPGEADYWNKYAINPFEMDYNRIVTSSAFRRLQDKTQVFPLSKSDFVRTRLTHSIEVSTIAFQMGQMLAESMPENEQDSEPLTGEEKEENKKIRSQIPSVLRCAGIIHDLGNPPFGHFGEEAIGSWFRANLDRLQYKGRPLRECLTDRQAADLEHFEGNAQALRLLCKANHGGGINVSYAVISALVKYPTTSLAFDKKNADIKLHKPGVFEAEAELFQTVSEAVGTRMEDGKYCRHPLTYLMEAADDIAYVTSDLEDAYKKGLFTLHDFSKYCSKQVKEYKEKGKYVRFVEEIFQQLDGKPDEDKSDDTVPGEADFSAWLYCVRRWLMYCVIWRMGKNYKKIMDGTYKKELFAGTNHEFTVKILKDAMGEFVYDEEKLTRSELSGQTIISFLLDGFVKAALHDVEEYKKDKDKSKDEDVNSDWKPSQVDCKYFNLISKRYRDDYEKTRTGDEGYDLYLRLLMVTDHISGMTDAYARDLFRELRGVE